MTGDSRNRDGLSLPRFAEAHRLGSFEPGFEMPAHAFPRSQNRMVIDECPRKVDTLIELYKLRQRNSLLLRFSCPRNPTGIYVTIRRVCRQT